VLVDLDVTRPTAVRGHLGDIAAGLATGLTGDRDAVVEGLAVVVTSAGRPLLVAATAVRAGGGTIAFGPGVRNPGSLTATGHFPDLTGGPPTISIGISSPGRR
jgi:hypothetical protein